MRHLENVAKLEMSYKPMRFPGERIFTIKRCCDKSVIVIRIS